MPLLYCVPMLMLYNEDHTEGTIYGLLFVDRTSVLHMIGLAKNDKYESFQHPRLWDDAFP